ncbi:MAG: flagellar hook-associated protein FlgL, partial [Acidaminobacteraceae bacterium]
MRITNNMLVNNLLSNVNKNLVNMSKMQEQLSSGKRVQSASDDPVAASKIIKYKTDLSENAQYERNTSDALSWLETTESTMMDINKVLQRAREAAVKAANGTNTDEDVEKIASELEQLKKQIIMDGNFSFAGRYVFSGYHTEEKLFNEDGTYAVGLTDVDIKSPPIKQYQIGVGEDIQISTNGLDLFGSIAETGAFVDSMPSGKNTDSALIKKSEMTIELELDIDHSLAGAITFEFNGDNYDVDMTSLDLSAIDVNDPVQVAAAQTTIIDSVKNAEIPPATGTLLDSVVDVSFNDAGELVISAKNNGDFSISQVSATGFKDRDGGGLVIEGASTALIGDSIATASNQTEMLIGFDPTLDHSGSQITYEIDGVNYDVVMTNLDLSDVDPSVQTEVELARSKILDSIKNAEANPPTIPQTTISDTADVFFTDKNQLVIRAKNYDDTSMSQVSATGFYEKNGTGTPVVILAVETGGISNVSNAVLVADNA